MDFIKKFCIFLIPIATILTFLAVGMSINGGSINITYLEPLKLTTNTLGQETFKQTYHINWQKYLQGLTNTTSIENGLYKVLSPVENILIVFQRFAMVWENGYDLGDVIITIFNGVLLLIDLAICIIDILIGVLIFICTILSKLLNIIGINTYANNIIFNIGRTILNSNLLPYISPVVP